MATTTFAAFDVNTITRPLTIEDITLDMFTTTDYEEDYGRVEVLMVQLRLPGHEVLSHKSMYKSDLPNHRNIMLEKATRALIEMALTKTIVTIEKNYEYDEEVPF